MFQGKKLSLNLAGGGAKGLHQFGSLKAWVDLGLKEDMVMGTSVGSLNAALYHQGDMDKLEQMWMTITNDKVYKFHWWTVPQLLINRNNLYDATPLKNLINEVVDFKKLRANPVPLYISATNLTDWTPETYTQFDLDEEDFKTFLLCSASPPGAFQPIKWRGKEYCDGGVCQNYNVLPAVHAGADIIVVMSSTVRDPNSKMVNEIDMLSLLTSVPEYCYLEREFSFIDQINKIQEPFPNLRFIKHILVRPTEPLDISLLNFSYNKPRQTYINMGYNLALETLNRELLCTTAQT